MNDYGELYNVGRVIRINGTMVEVEAYHEKNSKTINFNGELLRNIQVFGNVAIKNGYDMLIGEITGENTEYIQGNLRRIFKVKILGSISDDKFISGIDKIAMIDNNVFLINNVLNNIMQPNSNDMVVVGKSVFNNSNMVLNKQKLYASHVGIFGNTGSGKSYTLSKVLELYFTNFTSNINHRDKNYLFDLTGEYNELESESQVYSINGVETNLPKVKLDLEALAILLNATEATQKPLLKIAYNKLMYQGMNLDWSSIVKTIVIYGDSYLRSEFIDCITEEYIEIIKQYSVKINFGSHQLWRGSTMLGEDRNISKLEEFFDEEEIDFSSWNNDIEISFLNKLYIQLLSEASQYSNLDYVVTVIQRFSQRKNEISKYIEFVFEDVELEESRFIIYDLSELTDEYKKIIVTLLANQIYKSRDKNAYFIKIIIDEAHNILSRVNTSSDTFSEFSIQLFKKILKEGRKDNVFTYISSQRPSEIDETIVSQIHNFFIHNLKNYNDIHIIEKAVPFITKDKIEIISGLSKGTVLFGGLASERADIFKVEKIQNDNNIPRSHNVDIGSFLN